MSFLKSFINLIFSDNCLSCNQKKEPSNNYLCLECEKKLEELTVFCPVCGSSMSDSDCKYCTTRSYNFTKARSLYSYNNELQSLIHNLKYNEVSGIAVYFAEKLSAYIDEYEPFEQIDLVCPVPLHRVKRRERGYNQAELISRHLARKFGWLHAPRLISRIRYTETQTTLSKEKRSENVENAFKINSKYDLRDKNILIIDDVFTTGATVNSMSNLLKSNGVGKIYVLTIARA